MRKRICLALLAALVLLVVPSPVLAQTVDWNLVWQDDGSIRETVRLTGVEVSVGGQEWNLSESGSQQIMLTRRIENWTSYNQLNDRLPVSMASRDFAVLQIARISSEDYQYDPAGLYAQVAALSDVQLTIQVPGVVREHSADMVENSQKAVWKLNRLDHLLTEDLMLRAIIFDGLLLAVLLVGGAAIVIVLVFLRSIHRVNQLIEEEYSLESLESPPDTDESQEE